jgi:hypothetical protein
MNALSSGGDPPDQPGRKPNKKELRNLKKAEKKKLAEKDNEQTSTPDQAETVSEGQGTDAANVNSSPTLPIHSGKQRESKNKKDPPGFDDDNIAHELVANHFVVIPGKDTVFFMYDLATFYRCESEKEQQVRREQNQRIESGQSLGPNENAVAPAVFIGTKPYVKVSPARLKRRRLVRLLLEKLSEANEGVAVATDYFEHIITAPELKPPGLNLQEYDLSDDSVVLLTENDEQTDNEWRQLVTYHDEYQSGTTRGTESFIISITPPKRIDLNQVKSSLRRKDENASMSEAEKIEKNNAVRALNTIFSYRPYQSCFSQPSLPESEPSSEPIPEPDFQARLTTKNGSKFHGIATRTVAFREEREPQDIETTDTGDCSYLEPGNTAVVGFGRSVRTSVTQRGLITLNVNVATSIFYQRTTTLHDLIELWKAESGTGDEMISENPGYKALCKFLNNIRVRSNCCPQHQNFFGRVTGLADATHSGWKPTPANCTMKLPKMNQNENNLAVTQYLRNHSWSPELLNTPNVLVVNLGEGDHIVTLPATHLNVIPGQMNRNTEAKPKAGVITPLKNKQLVLAAKDILLGTDEDNLGARQFGIGLRSTLLRVPLQTLPMPTLTYIAAADSKDQEELKNGLRLGIWNLRGMRFLKPAKTIKWALVEIRSAPNGGAVDPGCTPTELSKYKASIKQEFEKYGMTEIEHCDTAHERVDPQDDKVENLLSDLKRTVELVVFVLPDKNANIYGAIKRAGDQKVGINTLCVVRQASTRTVDGTKVDVVCLKNDVGTIANLALKVNLKSGDDTVNHALKSNDRVLTNDSLIIGVDVTHPGAGAMQDSPSIAAVVGSLDSQFARWSVGFKAQMPQAANNDPDSTERKQAVEKVLELKALVKDRIEEWRQRRIKHEGSLKARFLPDKIIVFRDGLSEDQFTMCENEEYPQIKAAVNEIWNNSKLTPNLKGPKPRVLLICAVKRHHTRCFPDDKLSNELAAKSRGMFICKSASDKPFNYNPLPGRYIDQLITYGEGKDFFLYSQNAIIGTARPTHYVIIKKDDFPTLRLSDVAQMTYNLCFILGRATRSTSVCTPVFYADLAADRARHYVRDVYNVQYEPKKPRPIFRERDQGTKPATKFDLTVHRDVQKRMFFI